MDLTNHPHADEIRAITDEITMLAWQTEPDTPEWDEMLERVSELLKCRQRLYEEGRRMR